MQRITITLLSLLTLALLSGCAAPEREPGKPGTAPGNPRPANSAAALNAGESNLIGAAGRGDLKQVQDLVSQGANVNAKDGSGRTPLAEAAFAGHAEVVRFLLEKGADPNARKNDGATIIQLASGKKEVLELLRKAGAKEFKAELVLPLMEAARNGENAKIQQLLDQGADVNGADSDGRTALTEAIFSGRAETVQMLLDKGANPNAKKKDGATPLGLSIKYPAISEMLKKAGAK